MSKAGLQHESHQEVVGALRRHDRMSATERPRPTDLVKLAAVGCIGAGVMLDGVAVLVALTVLGTAALWMSFTREDAAVADTVESAFDPLTGLPLERVLDKVMTDELVSRSLSGRFAVVSIEVPEIVSREIVNDKRAAEALMVAITHRIESQGWVESARGPFSPLLFLRRPGVFFIVLRDVIDDQTTRFLARRMIDIVNKPVPFDGDELTPRAVIGLAVGTSAERHDLVAKAGKARSRARREGAGAVVSSDREEPTAASLWNVAAGEIERMGPLIEPASAGGELFAENAVFLRSLDRATEVAIRSGERCFVQARSAALCHWDTPARVAKRLNVSGQHGRVGLVVPASVVENQRGLVWDNIMQLRRCGLDVYVGRQENTGMIATPISTLISVSEGIGPEQGTEVTSSPRQSTQLTQDLALQTR